MKPLSLLAICLLFLTVVGCSISEPELKDTPQPTNTPTPQPTNTPTLQPTYTATPQPTFTPTLQPTNTITPTPEPVVPQVSDARFVVMDASKFELWLELVIIPPNASIDIEVINEILRHGILQWMKPNGNTYLLFSLPLPLESSSMAENFSDALSGPAIRLDLSMIMDNTETGTYRIQWVLPEGSFTIGRTSPVLLDTGVIKFTWDNQELVIIE